MNSGISANHEKVEGLSANSEISIKGIVSLLNNVETLLYYYRNISIIIIILPIFNTNCGHIEFQIY